MEKASKVRGVYAPITTPFLDNEELDEGGLRRNMAFYAASPLHGYLALGSNGENKSLSWEEKLKVLSIIAEGRGKNQTLMAGIIFDSTIESLRFIREAEKLRPNYLTLLAPSYFAKQMTDDVLFHYFSTLADSTNIPCLLYNAPQFSGGVVLSAALISRLSSHPNILGVKDSYNAASISSYLLAAQKDLSVMAGSADYFLYAMTLGATGGVLSLANIFPALTNELYELALSGQFEKAFTLNKKVLQLNKGVSGKGGVAAVKYAMDIAGLCGGKPRLPLLPLEKNTAESIKNVITEFQNAHPVN
ncbi:dihydrodipicolinate synthase family protein [Spirochaetia bacterium]|nr:dihydrodipicolinate synthase family protein [Spirochaetia bacterium]